jgi:hypothetical protein
VDKWQGSVRLEADRNHVLLTRFGYPRWFWDVYHWRPVKDNYQERGSERCFYDARGQKWSSRPGDDHEACIAFRPANDAFGIKRAAMVKLREREWDARYGLVNEIHDALVFDCARSLEDECLANVSALMTAPCPYLVDAQVAHEGLHSGVSIARGPNMADLEEV